MQYNEILNIIVSEPIYLAIAILLFLSFIYSVLKKFFTLLIIILLSLVGYILFLIYIGEDLPGESDQVIYPFIETAKEKADSIIEEFTN